jgi:hypothetical protein
MINEKFTDARLDEQALDEVVGGNQYYSTIVYRRNKIGIVDGGKTFFYQGHEISENDAASIVFYKSEFPPNKVKKQEEKGWDTFIHVVNAYRNQNGERFKLHWMANK